jgi:hypothetical protein
VCNAEKIAYCGLADLIEREDWKFGNVSLDVPTHMI